MASAEQHNSGIQLYDAQGQRKYLTPAERQAFIIAAADAPAQARTFCLVLAHTGCRLSEAVQLSADRVDFNAGQLIFETLKKRRKGVYRAVPAPPDLLDLLDVVHGLKALKRRKHKGQGVRLWPYDRRTGWLYVRRVMEAAGLQGPHASPKGLRHAFGIAAVDKNIPLNMVQKWLGHSQPTTTAIYLNAVGQEEQNLAARLW